MVAFEEKRSLGLAVVAGASLLVATICASVGARTVGRYFGASSALRRLDVGVDQHIYIVRHGDKYSSYPPCKVDEDPFANGNLCFSAPTMGDNPPLTPCGVRQAEHTAKWLVQDSGHRGGIKNIVVSPFARTLQSALPLARALKQELKVEYTLSEAMEPEGPFREHNVRMSVLAKAQLTEISGLWDLHYGSPPIRTPENNTLYGERVKKAARVLKERFSPSSGNLAIFTHATTSFSVAYGLCYGDAGDAALQEFVDHQDAIAPSGVIHLTIGANGECKGVTQTQNVAVPVNCGETQPFKCNFAGYPSWYWATEAGMGLGKC